MKIINNVTNILNKIVTDNNEYFDKLIKDMSTHQKMIFSKIVENQDFCDNYTLNDLLFDFDKNFIEKLLSIEIDYYLKNQINDPESVNKKNGYTKDISLTIGNKTINYNRPRLRNEKNFDSILIPKKTRILKDLSDNILLLYSKNNSVKDIKEILIEMFNIDISIATISKFVNEISEEVVKWRNKELKKGYLAVNIDCTYISIRDNKNLTKHKIPIYIAIGTNFEGNKEILGTYLGNEDEDKLIKEELYSTDIGESSTFWTEVFSDIKDRGCEYISFVVSDGLQGINNAIHTQFPNAKHQRCVFHLITNLKQYTTQNNRVEILKDFKQIYDSNSLDLFNENFNTFVDKHQKKKALIKKVNEYYNLLEPLFHETENIRKYIYTNNISESANSKLKRGFYGRGSLPNANSAINIIYFNLIDLEKKWQQNKINNWDNIFNDLTNKNLKYYENIKQYL